MLQARSYCPSAKAAVTSSRVTAVPLRTATPEACRVPSRTTPAASRSIASVLSTSVAVLSAGGSSHHNRPARMVRTAARSTSTEPWWTKDNPPNMVEAHDVQEFVDLLADAQDKLVIVEFFATWCNACKSLFPKICKIMGENPDVVFIKVNFEDNRQLAKALGIKVLPFFHFYKGAEGRVAAFSCSISKIALFRDALETHSGAFCNLEPFSGLPEFPEVEPHPMAVSVPTGFDPIEATSSTSSMDATATIYETLVSVDASADSLPMVASVLSNGVSGNGVAAVKSQENGVQQSGSVSSSVPDGNGAGVVKVPDAVPLEVLAGWRAAEVQGNSGLKHPGAEGQLATV